jgi:hypothetical protein
MKHLSCIVSQDVKPHPQPLSDGEGSIRRFFSPLSIGEGLGVRFYVLSIFILIICHTSSLAQKKDTVFRQHLVLKFAPLMYFGNQAAIQVGLETNLTQKMTIGFDFAYGDSEIASHQKGGSYYEGEVSQRYRLDLRWYESSFASSKYRGNQFWGMEFFNRTNTYATPVTIGRGILGTNQYNYYERSSANATNQVWGIFFKYGNVHTLSSRFFLETYVGLGVTRRSNTITKPVTLGEFDQLADRGSSINFWGFHSQTDYREVGGDFLLGAKLNYRIF